MKAKVRDGNWENIYVCDLEAEELSHDEKAGLPELVTAICCDSFLGLYVLTADEDRYFIAQSIDLEFIEEQN